MILVVGLYAILLVYGNKVEIVWWVGSVLEEINSLSAVVVRVCKYKRCFNFLLSVVCRYFSLTYIYNLKNFVSVLTKSHSINIF